MTLWLRATGDGQYQWWRTAGELQEGDLADLTQQLGPTPERLCLLVSGAAVVSHAVTVPAKARRHLARLVPYQLEEQLLDDVADCHFAWAAPVEVGEYLHIPVAVCRRDWLAAQLAPLSAAGLEPDAVYHAPRCLPPVPATWVARLEHRGREDQELWLRLPDGRALSLRPALAPLVLEQLLAEDAAPEGVLALAASADELLTLRSLLPEALRAQVQTRIETTAQSVGASPDPADPVNLRRGAFAKPLPLRRWWREWRSVAALLLVAVLAYIAVQALEYRQLSERRQALAAQVEAQYRAVVPEGPMVEPVRQLRRQLAQLQGVDSGRGAVALLNAALPAVAKSAGVELRTLSFHRDRGELRLQCWAPSFAAVDTLRRDLQSAGLAVELINTSADGEGQQARLRLTWGPV